MNFREFVHNHVVIWPKLFKMIQFFQQKIVYKEYVEMILNERNIKGCHREIWQSICMKHAGTNTIVS